uniref:Uncharacterized protein n=1 Tax=Anguilla anguilla TaxID=7936 RepID=A0A0E9V7K8_ANGAN
MLIWSIINRYFRSNPGFSDEELRGRGRTWGLNLK